MLHSLPHYFAEVGQKHVMMDTTSVSSVLLWLTNHGVDISRWKSSCINKLMGELEKGEVKLELDEKGRAIRCLSVAKVLIKSGTQILIEEKEVTASGHVRLRNAPLSEKIMGGEDPLIAGQRGVKEELGVEGAMPELVSSFVEDVSSSTFPGLVGRYNIYVMTMMAAGIGRNPAGKLDSFTTREGDRIHYWKWVEASTVNIGKGAKPQRRD